MRRIWKGRPHAAAVVGLALVSAVAGSAIAHDPVATSTLTKKEKRRVNKLAKKRAKKLDGKQDSRNFPVESAQIGDGAVTETKIAGGLPPRAWANISPSGAIKDGEGIAQADVTAGTAGHYCFDGVGGAMALASGSYFAAPGPSYAHVLDAAAAAFIGGFVAKGCPASTTWMVVTTKADGTPVESDFAVAFFD